MEKLCQRIPKRPASPSAPDQIGILTSYFYFKKFDYNQLPSGIELILDSGAFSAYTLGKSINLTEYAEWARDLNGKYRFALNLDVLGNEKESLKNWEILSSKGINATPVIHFGSRADKVLPPYLEQGANIVALGGIAVSGAGKQVQAWTSHVFKWLKENAPHISTHGLGVHGSNRLAKFPFTTIDSSTPTGAYRFGRLPLFDDRAKKWVTVKLDGKTPYQHGSIIRSYGLQPSQVAVSNSETMENLLKLIMASEIASVDFYRETANPNRKSFMVASHHKGANTSALKYTQALTPPPGVASWRVQTPNTSWVIPKQSKEIFPNQTTLSKTH